MSVGGGVVRSHDVDVDQGVWLLLTAFWTCLWAFSPVLSVVRWAGLNGVRAEAGLLCFMFLCIVFFVVLDECRRAARMAQIARRRRRRRPKKFRVLCKLSGHQNAAVCFVAAAPYIALRSGGPVLVVCPVNGLNVYGRAQD